MSERHETDFALIMPAGTVPPKCEGKLIIFAEGGQFPHYVGYLATKTPGHTMKDGSPLYMNILEPFRLQAKDMDEARATFARCLGELGTVIAAASKALKGE